MSANVYSRYSRSSNLICKYIILSVFNTQTQVQCFLHRHRHLQVSWGISTAPLFTDSPYWKWLWWWRLRLLAAVLLIWYDSDRPQYCGCGRLTVKTKYLLQSGTGHGKLFLLGNNNLTFCSFVASFMQRRKYSFSAMTIFSLRFQFQCLVIPKLILMNIYKEW